MTGCLGWVWFEYMWLMIHSEELWYKNRTVKLPCSYHLGGGVPPNCKKNVGQGGQSSASRVPTSKKCFKQPPSSRYFGRVFVRPTHFRSAHWTMIREYIYQCAKCCNQLRFSNGSPLRNPKIYVGFLMLSTPWARKNRSNQQTFLSVPSPIATCLPPKGYRSNVQYTHRTHVWYICLHLQNIHVGKTSSKCR